MYIGRSGPGSVVGIATDYGLDGPGIESRWGRDFPHLSIPALGPTQPPENGYRVFPGSKERPWRNADPSPPSSAVIMKGLSYTSTPPMGRTACTEPQCLRKVALYLFVLNVDSPGFVKCGLCSVISFDISAGNKNTFKDK